MAIYDNGYIVTFEDNTQILVPRDVVFTSPFVQRHTIAEEETIYDIAKKYYNNTVDWYLIMEANRLVDPVVLIPGDALIIPNNG